MHAPICAVHVDRRTHIAYTWVEDPLVHAVTRRLTDTSAACVTGACAQASIASSACKQRSQIEASCVPELTRF